LNPATRLIARLSLRLFGLLLFVAVLWKFDAVSSFKALELNELWVPAVGIIGVVHLLKAYRWRLILGHLDVFLRFRECFAIYLAGMFLGIITPGRVGDFVKVIYLQERGVASSRALLATLVDKACDVLLMGGMALASSVVFARLFDIDPVNIGISLLAATALLALGKDYVKLDNIQRLVTAVLIKLFGSEFAELVSTGLSKLFSDCRIFLSWRVAVLGAITVVTWILYFYAVLLFSWSAGLEIPAYHAFLFSVAAASVFVLLPISIAGIGTRDVTLAVLFTASGYTPEQSILFSTAILIVYVQEAVTGLVFWSFMPIRLSRVRSFS
jgi:uncharacterized protein (TIRG00374 family)